MTSAPRPQTRQAWHRSLGSIAAVAALALAAAAAPLAGQATGTPSVDGADRWFPPERYFAPLLADPHEARYSAGLVMTDLFDFARTDAAVERPPFRLITPYPSANDVESDLHGTVALGASVPVWRLGAWDGGGATLGAMVAVFARFRMEPPSRDMVADDWYVGVPLEMRDGRFSLRARFFHRSSHMGDEVQEGGARRIELSYEAIDALGAWSFSPTTRVYAGPTLVLHVASYILAERQGELRKVGFPDTFAFQAGGETGWLPWADGTAGLVAGIDWKSAERSDWRGELEIVGGLTGELRGRTLRLLARCHRGPSSLGEFFRTDEEYCGLEATAEL